MQLEGGNGGMSGCKARLVWRLIGWIGFCGLGFFGKGRNGLWIVDRMIWILRAESDNFGN